MSTRSPTNKLYHHHVRRTNELGASEVAATPASSSYYPSMAGSGADEPDLLPSFHPVDEPDLQVVASGIFEAALPSRSTSTSSASASALSLPTYISDEEISPTNAAHYFSDMDEEDDEREFASWPSKPQQPQAAQSISASSWPGAATIAVNPSFDESEEAAADDEREEEEERDEEADDEDYYEYDEDCDRFEARKRREESVLDEEQLRKRRRIEEEERVARNKLWRQSLRRSMFFPLQQDSALPSSQSQTLLPPSLDRRSTI